MISIVRPFTPEKKGKITVKKQVRKTEGGL
jgi:hypothetical protein